ncbi:MAG: hypothetical protein NC417_10990 [Candidatus Gastranaerophilales bacterium]|nr:hypothetical protein [Candidatus Gastranaerophilales bacterium]
MRLTRQQMAEKYPDQYLGITNIQYENNDGVTIESAEVIYTDKSEEELLSLQVSGAEDIMCWYTTGSNGAWNLKCCKQCGY